MTRTSRRLLRLLRNSEGANLMEAAIMTPLLLLLTFGIVDFASLLYVHAALQNGVSQATRYAVTGQTQGGQNREGSIRWAMRQHTPTLTIPDGAFSFSHMAPGAGGWTGGAGGPGDIEKVTVEYTWTLMTPLLRPFFTNGQITFRAESAMKNEGVFTQ